MWDRHQQITAVAVLLIAGGVIGFWLGRSAERGALPEVGQFLPPAPGATSPPPAQGTLPAGGNAIAVNDQPPGSKVAIPLLTLARDGWVVVHEEAGGWPGAILGAQRFNAGANQSGSVELLRPTEEGKVYFAMLHADDGDRQFDHTKDLPIQDPQGNTILMRFVAAAGPAER